MYECESDLKYVSGATKAAEPAAVGGHVRTIWYHQEDEVEVTLQTKRWEHTEAWAFDMEGAF